MKRFVGLSVAAVALVVPLTPALASGPAAPAEYRPECESTYQGGKAAFDPLIASPAKAALAPLEQNLCGQNKHVPA